MNYTFERHDPAPDRIVLALILDMKRKKERILIGSENRIESHLRGSEEDDIYYDRIAPLGNLLMNFHQDTDRTWNQYGFMPLWDALHTNRKKQPELEATAFNFLQSKYEGGYPLDIYAAIRISDGYLNARLPKDRDRAADSFNMRMSKIKDGLMDWTDEMIRTPKMFYGENPFSKEAVRMDLWYPTGSIEPECVLTYDSILPVIIFYHNRLLAAGLNIRKCKVCGKSFLAESLKYGICSERCRKKQNTIKKREFDARATENVYDKIYKNECQRWLNYIHRLEKDPNFSPDQISKLKTAFTDFKAEAKKRKASVKTGRSSLADFQGWTLQQLDKHIT